MALRFRTISLVVACAFALLPESVGAMTRPASSETIIGEYTGPGAPCPQFRMANGETVSLSGAYRDLVPGEQVTLSGRWAVESKCMQGREFNVLQSGG